MPTNILDDFVPEGDFATEIGVGKRTIGRYRKQPDGLPFAMIGGRIFICKNPTRDAR
jgi:hypothetical protein